MARAFLGVSSLMVTPFLFEIVSDPAGVIFTSPVNAGRATGSNPRIVHALHVRVGGHCPGFRLVGPSQPPHRAGSHNVHGTGEHVVGEIALQNERKPSSDQGVRFPCGYI